MKALGCFNFSAVDDYDDGDDNGKFQKYTDFKEETTEPRLYCTILLSTNGIIPNKLHDSLILLNLRYALHILMQKAVIINTFRTVVSF